MKREHKRNAEGNIDPVTAKPIGVVVVTLIAACLIAVAVLYFSGVFRIGKSAASGAEIDLPQLRQLMSENKLILLDVRTTGEFNKGRLPGARNIPLEELEARLSELDPSKPIVVYCVAGGRSSKAQRLLLEHGFENVLHYRGGVRDWAYHDQPFER